MYPVGYAPYHFSGNDGWLLLFLPVALVMIGLTVLLLKGMVMVFNATVKICANCGKPRGKQFPQCGYCGHHS